MTLPLLRPLILVISLWRSLALIQMFDIAYTLTEGGPGRLTQTLSLYDYNLMFSGYQVGKASAASYLIFVICLAVGLMLIKVMGLRGSDEGSSWWRLPPSLPARGCGRTPRRGFRLSTTLIVCRADCLGRDHAAAHPVDVRDLVQGTGRRLRPAAEADLSANAAQLPRAVQSGRHDRVRKRRRHDGLLGQQRVPAVLRQQPGRERARPPSWRWCWAVWRRTRSPASGFGSGRAFSSRCS